MGKKNRNLSYEPRQAWLISLVEQVLEDGIITDEEREILIDNCSEYTALETDSSAKIYELNGIIEGVISDNEINEKKCVTCRNGWELMHPSFVIISLLKSSVKNRSDTWRWYCYSGGTRITSRNTKKRLNHAQIETKIGYLKTCVKERKISVLIWLIYWIMPKQ